MKKFVCMMVVFMMAIAGFASCIAEGHRYEIDPRVSFSTILALEGNAFEYIELGQAFTFEIEHYDDGTASLIIWRHVDGEDSEWLNYFCTGHMEMDPISPWHMSLRTIIEENLDFCLDTMDLHEWA